MTYEGDSARKSCGAPLVSATPDRYGLAPLQDSASRMTFGPPATVDLSIVIPVFNEATNVEPLCKRLRCVLETLPYRVEVIFVNDGSTDATLESVRNAAANWPIVRAVDLSRRFGKEAALTCGLSEACGRAVISMDGDLQHPPETIPQLVERWREGFEMVFARRLSREDQNLVSRVYVRAFYWLFDRLSEVRLPRDAGDFRLFDRKVVDALNGLPERNRFMKGLYAWLGFRTTAVTYECAERVGGRSKWSRLNQLRFAFDALTAFSNLPLRVFSFSGAVVSLLAFFYIAVRLVRVAIYGIDVPGYESILAAVLFLGGVQLVCLGVIGDYIGRVFEETKRRPLFVVRARYAGVPEAVSAQSESLESA
jgi:glycosyltransferase involved in cell wall biosynthesis